MKEKTKELTLAEAMNRFGLGRLPARAKEGDLWAIAIVLVMKTNGKQYYAIQGSDPKGNLVIREDFEGDHGIVSVLSAYPVVKFKAEIDGKPLAKADRLDKEVWLGHVPHPVVEKTSLGKMTDGEIDDLIIRCLRLREMDFQSVRDAEKHDKPEKKAKGGR